MLTPGVWEGTHSAGRGWSEASVGCSLPSGWRKGVAYTLQNKNCGGVDVREEGGRESCCFPSATPRPSQAPRPTLPHARLLGVCFPTTTAPPASVISASLPSSPARHLASDLDTFARWIKLPLHPPLVSFPSNLPCNHPHLPHHLKRPKRRSK